MTALERIVPAPSLLEIDGVDLALPIERAWELLRHGDLARSRLVNALFAIRTLPERMRGPSEPMRLRIDDMRSSADRPGFHLLVEDPPRELVVGAIGKVWQPDIEFLHVPTAEAFAALDEPGFIKVAWAIQLRPLGEHATHVSFEVRVAPTDEAAWKKFRAYWHVIGIPSRFIRRSLLGALAKEHGAPESKENERHLAARIEGRMPADDLRDVAAGVGGAAIMVAAMLTPFLRRARSHWGLDAATAERRYPGDELVPEPRWSWTHGIEIDAPAEEVWPWVAQIGADRAGFYSYQWLENIAGCEVRNAEAVHPSWAVREGDALRLHPDLALRVVSLREGEHCVAHAPADPAARAAGEGWAEVTWLFFVEPLGRERCRFISRYRIDCADDIATRIKLGPTFVEPIGFAMDRRMLMGVKERAERARRRANPPRSPAQEG